MNNNIDELINTLSIEELQILAGDEAGSQININNSTINIYNTPKRYSTSTPPDYTPIDEDAYYCPHELDRTAPFCETYCEFCESQGATNFKEEPFSLLGLPIPLAIAVAPFYLTFKGISSIFGAFGSSEEHYQEPQLQLEEPIEDIIDTEIVSTVPHVPIEQQIATLFNRNESEEDLIEREINSMEALLNNPENAKYLGVAS